MSLIKNKWLNKKPVFKEACILIVAQWFGFGSDKYWEYTLYTIQKADGYNDKEEPCYYWGIFCADGDEWGDLADLVADKYLILPPLKIQKL